jgi:hypothetical protein
MSDSLFPVFAAIAAASALWYLARWANVALALRRVRSIDIASGARVGILIACDDSPTHTHQGALPFTGYTRTYGYDWRLRAEVAKALTAQLEADGLESVDMREAGLQLSECTDLVQPRLGSWHVADHVLLRRLRDRFGLSALLVVRTARVTALIEGGGEQGSFHSLHAEGTGLFTMAGLWSIRYFAVVAQQWHVYWLAPPADLAFARPLRQLMDIPSVQLETFARPVDLKNLSPQNLEPVRQQVIAFIHLAAATAVASLKATGRQRGRDSSTSRVARNAPAVGRPDTYTS